MKISLNPDKMITSVRIARHGLRSYMGVFSNTSPRERLQLFEIAKLLPNQASALEIGSHIGSSALFICAALARLNGHLFCVDTWMNNTMPGGLYDNYVEFQENTKKFSFMITMIRKRSEDLSFGDVGCPLDFVFIDGDHSEEAVRRDFQLISDWVKVGGVVAFHDLHPVYPGVNIVVGEALATGKWQLGGLADSLGWIRCVR